MKLCFNEATTLENSTLAQDLVLCEKAGYDYIEIRTMDKLPEYLKMHSLEELKMFFTTHHLKPYALNALVFFNNRSAEEYAALLEEYRYMLEVAQYLHIPKIVVVPLVTEKKIATADIEQSAIHVLRELCDLALPAGVEVALEFVGHPQCTINTFEQAYQIVEQVDRHNIGVVFDCFHFYAMNSNIQFLETIDASKISILHVDDTEDYRPGMLTDEDRVWPGEGVIPLQTYFKILQQRGFNGVASIELFRPAYYQLPAEQVVETGKRTMENVLQVFQTNV